MPDQPMGAGRGRAFRCESGCRRPEGQERPEGPSGRGTGAARGTGALKRSGSDMSLPRTLGELQLFCLLQRANLTAYYQNFIQQGGDDVRQLCEAGEEEFLEIMVLVGMASKPLHVRRLQKALREWMANPAAFHRPLASSLSRFKLSTASPHKPKRKALDGGSDAFPEGKRLRSLVPAPTGSVSPNSSSDGEGRGIPALGSEEEEEEGELESRDVGRSGEAPGYLRLNRTLAKPVGVEGSAPVKKEELLEQGSERRDSEQPTQQVGS